MFYSWLPTRRQYGAVSLTIYLTMLPSTVSQDRRCTSMPIQVLFRQRFPRAVLPGYHAPFWHGSCWRRSAYLSIPTDMRLKVCW
ncbi:hypothetical protein F4803DRAFT_505031 [Xylaria telfairii]|nr:hypothetical protein F4803DRAFT_505031 [Xylaria telfairii]